MNPLDSSELSKARERLLKGDVVAIPTETVYGLAASIESEAGLRKIFALKERPFFDPLIVHVASIAQAQSVASLWPAAADFLARTFWPGPLTLVLPKAEHVNPLITSGLATVAVRYPSHPVALDLIRLAGTPLAAPSANKFGKTSPSRAQHVRTEFPQSDLLIIDGGECEIGLESTVISFADAESGQPQVQILRPGGITEEMLREALTRFWPAVDVVRKESHASPGTLQHHYMPRIPLVIVPGSEPVPLLPERLEMIASGLKIALPSFARELALSADPVTAARELYAEMRSLSESGADLLYVKALPERQGGLWSAIWDRLQRAASYELK